MGDHQVKRSISGEQLRSFMHAVLNDLRALEQMIEQGMIEQGHRRIGAEQELFLVDRSWNPAPYSTRVLDSIDDPRFTTELALFNLEANLEPVEFGGDCLSRMEGQLVDALAKAREAAHRNDAEIVLIGILPTIRKSDLGMENITPDERYYALNDALRAIRGEDYEFRIRGLDQLMLKHDSCMLESCNASFQAHFQVSAEEFPMFYNISQVMIAPVLAAASNSPMLFGKRLWAETRIALFEQSIDTRRSDDHRRVVRPRVSFGKDWIRESILEIYRDDIARFRALLTTEDLEDPFDSLEKGEVPSLKALCLHNSTIYRWNRACYGITEGKPHLRIENRVLPSGPTAVDEVANAALWFGLIASAAAQEGDVTKLMEFEQADANFHAAARHGLMAQFTWFDGEVIPARELLVDSLLPMAREGLEEAGVRGEDIDRYIGVIEARVESESTGSTWILKSFHDLRNKGNIGEVLGAITAATVDRQSAGRPVAEWGLARLEEAGGWEHSFTQVEDFMSTDLFTVQGEEPIHLVANMMDWERIRHVMVEDDNHFLIGLVSYRSLLRHLANPDIGKKPSREIAVSEVMKRDLLTVTPSTHTLDAIELMRDKKVACLPVVDGGRLVGVVTERDFLDISAVLLEEKLRP